MKKEAMCEALRRFINQRSGIEWVNYQCGDWKQTREAFYGDYRPMLRYGKHARELLRAVELRESITAADMLYATRAFSGRLQFIERDGKVAVQYTTGQYFPTEYRNAACAVLASCLWDYFRRNLGEPDGKDTRNGFEHKTYKGLTAGDAIRKEARREFGRAIASTWFN